MFLLITADGAADLPVPGEPFSFGVLEMAQALGDFQSLERTGRRALHVHLPTRDAAALRRVASLLLGGTVRRLAREGSACLTRGVRPASASHRHDDRRDVVGRARIQRHAGPVRR